MNRVICGRLKSNDGSIISWCSLFVVVICLCCCQSKKMTETEMTDCITLEHTLSSMVLIDSLRGEAIKQLTQACQKYPSSLSLHVSASIGYLLENEDVKANRYLTRALHICDSCQNRDSTDKKYMETRPLILVLMGREEEARNEVRKIPYLAPVADQFRRESFLNSLRQGNRLLIHQEDEDE